MSGGIVQLVATGVQDVHLTGSPEVSFFRSNYKRHTHFASSVERMLIQGQPTPAGISTIRVERKGDLLSYMYLTARDSTGLTRSDLDWSQIIDRVELLIGGQVIDLQDAFYTYNIDPVCMASTYSQRYIPQSVTLAANDNAFYPLKFFFCKEWQTALPLIAMQYHDVDIRITWGTTLGTQVGPVGAPTSVAPVTDPAAEDSAFLYSISSGGAARSATVLTSNVVGNISIGAVVVGSVFNTNLVYVTDPSGITNAAGLGSGNLVLGFTDNITWSAVTLGNPDEAFILNPPVTASITIAAQGASAVTTCTATVNSVAGGQIEPGMVVTNPGLSGLVYISNVVYTAGVATSVTLNFPSQITNTLINSHAVGIFPGNVPFEPLVPSTLDFGAWGNFMYLDPNEREYFAKNAFEMLITQVQRVPIAPNTNRQEVVFNHPVKFIASNVTTYSQVNQRMVLQINGTEIGESRSLPHWVEVPQYYHTPYGYHAAGNTIRSNVLCIPFCLDTAKYQPTGTLNFSRIDTFRLVTPVEYSLQNLLASGVGLAPQGYLYAVNYNILKIENGMGGLRYGS